MLLDNPQVVAGDRVTHLHYRVRQPGTADGGYRSCSVGRISISLTATCRGRVTM